MFFGAWSFQSTLGAHSPFISMATRPVKNGSLLPVNFPKKPFTFSAPCSILAYLPIQANALTLVGVLTVYARRFGSYMWPPNIAGQKRISSEAADHCHGIKPACTRLPLVSNLVNFLA